MLSLTLAYLPTSQRLESGELISTLGHEASVWAIALSADGSGIVTGAADGTLHFWDAQTLGAHLRIESEELPRLWSAP